MKIVNFVVIAHLNQVRVNYKMSNKKLLGDKENYIGRLKKQISYLKVQIKNLEIKLKEANSSSLKKWEN